MTMHTTGQQNRQHTGSRRKPRLFWSTLAALTLAAIASALATGREPDGRRGDDNGRDGRDEYAIGLWGDLPYSGTYQPQIVPANRTAVPAP